MRSAPACALPNALQNLLGEGTLSASFIPVYSELLEEGRKEEAGRVAGAVFALLLAVAGGLALLGILFAPVIVSISPPGLRGRAAGPDDPRHPDHLSDDGAPGSLRLDARNP